jgi:hypothetical protein
MAETAPAASDPPAAAPADKAPAPTAAEELPSRDEITLAWGDAIISSLPQRAKVRFAGGHWVGVTDGAAVFGLPNQVHASRCEECKGDVEAALASHFGRPVPIRLVVDGDVPDPGDASPSGSRTPRPSAPEPTHDESIDLTELTDAHDVTSSGVDRIAAVFPGAELVSDDDS